MPSNKPLLSFIIDPDLLREIDDFRFGRRFPSRAAAIIWLIRRALKVERDERKGEG